MGFMDETPDLSRTVFTLEDLEAARQFWATTIPALDPDWLDRPRGILGSHWSPPPTAGGRPPDPYHWCLLIWISEQAKTIVAASTGRSSDILSKKLKGLLHYTKEGQFRETIMEIDLADHFASRGFLLDLEPTKADESRRGEHVSGPDFRAEGDGLAVYVEATYMRIDAITRWHAAIRELTAAARMRLKKLGQHRTLRATLPLNFPDLEPVMKRRLADAIASRDQGSMGGRIAGRAWHADWCSPGQLPPWPDRDLPAVIVPLRVFDSGRIEPYGGIGDPDRHMASLAAIRPGGLLESLGGVGTHGILGNVTLSEEGLVDFQEAALRKLSRKRGQFKVEGPAALVLQFDEPGSGTAEKLFGAVAEAVFSQDRFNRISAILELRPRDGFATSDLPAFTLGVANPRARWPIEPEWFSRRRPRPNS